MKRSTFILLGLFALAGCETSGSDTAMTSANLAPTPTATPTAGISDLVGARGSSGESDLMARGYTLARTEGLTAFWWNEAAQTCARVVTGDGRYQSADMTSLSDCGK